jgi:cellulose synthase operon protein YhjQ
MDMRLTENPEEPITETPEDVAILYSWANLHGAKYRDFSASRREYRAQVRHRAAEELRQAELNAQAEAEAAAAEAERVAREAERAARASERYDSPVDRERSLREAEEAARRASAERVEAARRAESAAIAEAAARREEREIAEAHASAQRQAARWHDSEIRRRSLAGPQPARVPGLGGDPYEVSQGANVDANLATPNRALEYTQPQRYRDEPVRPIYRQPEPELRPRRGFRPDQASGVRSAYRAATADMQVRHRIGNEFVRVTPVPAPYQAYQPPPAYPSPSYPPPPSYQPTQALPIRQNLQEEYYPPVAQRGDNQNWQPIQDQTATPAWLYGSPSVSQPVVRQPVAPTSGPVPVADTLQQSREKVASRWYALKGVFEASEPIVDPRDREPRQKELRTPVLAVFSLAGGVGKTSLVATLGRTLSSLGEKVLLADTTSHGLLPYYFGATELKPGVVRTFSPPSGSTDAPIHLVSYDVDQRGGDKAAQDAQADEMTNSATGVQRLLVDFNGNSGWLIRRFTRMPATVLVPVAPDMNSVISLQSVERYFQGAVDMDGKPLLPHYVLNQFDASLPLHLDVREVLRRQLGDRLLPYVIRRSQAVSEALAEGMTVVDYQPEGAIAEDYLNIAQWLRTVALPATQAFRTIRWSER